MTRCNRAPWRVGLGASPTSSVHDPPGDSVSKVKGLGTKEGTYCFVFRGDFALLTRMKLGRRYFGHWQALAGWLSPSETIEACAERICLEQAGLRIQSVLTIGKVSVFARSQRGEPDRVIHVTTGEGMKGDPAHDREGKFLGRTWQYHWFPIHKLPLSSMSLMDEYWVPFLFTERRFDVEFYLKGSDEDPEDVLGFKVRMT